MVLGRVRCARGSGNAERILSAEKPPAEEDWIKEEHEG